MPKGQLAWNKGLTKETSELVRKYSESSAKSRRGRISPLKGRKTGKPSPRKGKHPTEETLKKMSESHKGQIPWLKGKPRPRGEKSPFWKGGKKSYKIRSKSKRRQLGNIILNNPNIGWEGHHINKEYIVYIPSELHKSIYHNVWTGKNINNINLFVLFWLCYTEEINNCKEVN